MKERPILFSGPMVCEVLDDRKTQTRRIVKGEARLWIDDNGAAPISLCPYGVPGDRLWVRETFCEGQRDVNASDADDRTQWYAATFRGERMLKWKPAIHMPRWASRILLDITEVRVERLQAITEADARAEGIAPFTVRIDPGPAMTMNGHPIAVAGGGGLSAREVFSGLWDSINGKRASWESNPWAWVVSFKRVVDAARAA